MGEEMKELYKEINKRNAEKYERVNVLCPKGTKDIYREEAEKRGRTLSNFFIYAIENDLKENGL